jgi:hypothetical protein
MSAMLPPPSAQPAPDTGFAALRSEGIAALQRLCGAVWTDYNLHDPGVTTLEQLVYGLTDLGYRTGFDMADYLTGPDGAIDYDGLALYAPEAILPCGALTADDYRRLLYGAIPALADVWVRAADDGLLHVDVLAEEDSVPGVLAREVRRVIAADRALGTDVARVREVKPRAYYLRGEIDTGGDRSQAEVLARILFDCGAYLGSGLSARRLRDLLAEGRTPEETFDGPASRHGYVGVRAPGSDGAPVTVSELIAVIQRIEGVKRIRSLAIVDEYLQPCHAIPRDRASGTYGVLPFPSDEVTIELLRLQPEPGIEYGVSEQTIPPAPAWRAANRLLYEEGRLELAKLRFEQRAFRADEDSARTRYPLPAGRRRALHAYWSVQHEFPAVYGIGRYGLSADASDERRAHARQLQGFLYPMEQLMANFLQNLQELPTLFSLRDEGSRTYFAQYLDAPDVPGVADLYEGGARETADRVRRALARHDDHTGRKGRVLDYLLALYGEAFPQTALRRYNHYHPQDTEDWLLDAKRRLLAALVDLGAGRGRGCDYTLPLDAPGAVPPLARRAAILVGFDGGDGYHSLCASDAAGALALTEQDEQDAAATPPPAPADWLPVPPAADGAGGLPAGLRALGDTLPEELFRDGALLANYRLERSGGAYVLHVLAGAAWRALGSHGNRADAVAAAHAAVAQLARANCECEGMHIVEHVLLRPRTAHDGDATHGHGNPAFYEGRISVVLPRWTLRCADRSFRNFVEETVREHCPAHIQPAFLWLAPSQMAWFEALHEEWRAALRAWSETADEDRADRDLALHESAGALVHFLRAHRKEPA